MRDEINVERIAQRNRLTADALGLVRVIANRTEKSEPAATGAEYVTKIIVAVADLRIDPGLVLGKHRKRIIIRESHVAACIHEVLVARDQRQADTEITFVNEIDPIDRSNDSGLRGCGISGSPDRGDVLFGRGHREPVLEQHTRHPRCRLSGCEWVGTLRGLEFVDPATQRLRGQAARAAREVQARFGRSPLRIDEQPAPGVAQHCVEAAW